MDDDLGRRLTDARLFGDAQVLIELGCELAAGGDHIDAAWCFQQAEALGETWAAFNLGNELVVLGRDRDALVAYERAVAASETDAWLNMGTVLERLGDLAGALRAYEEGERSGDLNAGLSRAFLLRDTGERDRAEAVLAELARRGSALADAVGACWLWDRTLDPGLEPRMRAGAELYPSARADLAALLCDTDRVEEAVDVLRRGAELGETESFIRLGNVYADKLDRPDEAEAMYRAGIAAGDNNCHHNLATLLEDQDRLLEALEQYRSGAVNGDSLAQRALDRLGTEDEPDND